MTCERISSIPIRNGIDTFVRKVKDRTDTPFFICVIHVRQEVVQVIVQHDV